MTIAELQDVIEDPDKINAVTPFVRRPVTSPAKHPANSSPSVFARWIDLGNQGRRHHAPQAGRTR